MTDSGKGIPESKQEVIFEPGYTTKYNEAGIAATGIGLSHVRDIVHSMGGRITVEMKRHGRGTTFVTRLPKASIMKGAVPMKLSIIIVDDDIVSRSMLEDIIEESSMGS